MPTLEQLSISQYKPVFLGIDLKTHKPIYYEIATDRYYLRTADNSYTPYARQKS